MPTDLQKPFDAAVVMFTKRKGSLAAAVRSVFGQRFEGRVQVVVGVDGPDADREALAALVREVPDAMALTVVDPGYSTARSRGGLYAPEAGGALRTALTLLANARHVAYLSEVNRYAPHHLAELKRAIGDRAWAHSLRWFTDARTDAVICRDDWESVGPGGGVYAKSEGGFVATDDEFAAMLGRPIPAPAPVRPFNRSSTLEEMEETALGRMIGSVVLREAARRAQAEFPEESSTILVMPISRHLFIIRKAPRSLKEPVVSRKSILACTGTP